MTRAHRLAFLKVLAAAAWADGVVDETERNRIKALFNSFSLDPGDRGEVDRLLDRPVTFERALELTKEFASTIAPPGRRKELLAEIETMLGDEAGRTPEEAQLLGHVRAILSSHTVVDGLVEKFRGLFSRTLFARRESSARVSELTEFARNSALQRLEQVFRERGRTMDGDPATWNRVTLLGVLLAHIAHLHEGWNDGERDVVDRVLANRFAMDDASRDLLLTVLEEERGRDTDLQRICAEYNRISTMDDRLEILDALFTVGSVDGTLTRHEVEQIRRIADFLWISNREYLGVRDRWRERIEA
jgi:uncharacterized tellurite resistance protein B-like protein